MLEIMLNSELEAYLDILKSFAKFIDSFRVIMRYLTQDASIINAFSKLSPIWTATSYCAHLNI